MGLGEEFKRYRQGKFVVIDKHHGHFCKKILKISKSNQKSYIIEVQTIQLPTENKHNDKQWSTNTTQKNIHKIIVIGQHHGNSLPNLRLF